MRPIEITVAKLPFPNVHAVTLWPCIFFLRGFQDNVALRCHEFYHWRQALHWGVLPWYALYLILQIWYFHTPRNHPLEKGAYRRQDEVIAALGRGEDIDEPWL
ncbi:MAG: hypothetical protein ACE5Q6_21730 [Dehalococcoidia bacterium]